MRSDLKAAADAFLLKAYGLNKETRLRLIEKASHEIVQNCEQLFLSITSKREIATNKCAHKLKSNLNSLGFVNLAQEAKELEQNTITNDETIRRMVMELCQKITDDLPLP